MRAITVSEYGATPTLADLPKPKPGRGQILIKVHAAGVNPMDRMIANGGLKDRMPGQFPLILGADVAGVVEDVGEGESRFSRGDEVFGQLMIPPLGSAGTYAEYVAVTEGAPLARVPDHLEPDVAASLPTAGVTALEITELLEPLRGKTVLVVGAGGGVGSFVTQFAAKSGARVIANVHESAAERLRGYGAVETIDHTRVSLQDVVRRAHPAGIDTLVDLASDANAFSTLASLVCRGGTALTTRYVADAKALTGAGVTAVNFRVTMSAERLQQLAELVVAGEIVPPPINYVKLDDVPIAWSRQAAGHVDGKTVITP
jgi:NADPH:quinone reductase-like Zn-dependent oxidoreductase